MLRDLQYRYFPAGKITPRGWLKKQLTIEANGLVGHLDTVWPDIRDSRWIGGDRDGWERVPYWLDGFLPLAWLLDDPAMKARGKFYIDGILARQQEDGWLCPCAPEERRSYDPWAVLLLAKVLSLYADLAEEDAPRVEEALYRCLKQFNGHLDGATLHNWGASRAFEGLIPIFWLYERRPEDWLLLLADKLNVQGFDWQTVFDRNMLAGLTHAWDYLSHVVNLAMMLKCRALVSRLTGEDPDAFARRALRWLREHHGMACGHFTGDENLSGTSPIQGSELCSVVEAMYSFETLFSISGHPAWLDELEKEAFNALPATVSPDMWSHQYVQLTNQVMCAPLPHRVFRSNNEEAHLFGLEPNYGCCTANMGQGFSKLATSVFAATREGIACVLPLPACLHTDWKGVPVTVECESEYPFRTRVVYRVIAEAPVEFAFSLRVPGSVRDASLDGEAVDAGTMVVRRRTFGPQPTEFSLTFAPILRWEKRPSGLYCFWQGPLLFALPLGEKWEKVEYTAGGVERKFPYCDWHVTPTTPWAYAFAETTLPQAEPCPYDAPFTPDKPPLKLTLALAPIAWQMPDGRCALLPDSTKPLGESKRLTLIPYGCTNLRMTELPFAEGIKL